MKTTCRVLKIQLNLQSGSFQVDRSFRPIENDKPNWEDTFIDLKGVANMGCRFCIIRSNGTRINHEHICTVLHKTEGVIRLRLGECFAINCPDSDILRIFSVMENGEHIFLYDGYFAEEFVPDRLMDLLRESNRIRQSETDKMKHGTQAKENKPRRKTIRQRLVAAFKAFNT